MDYMLGCNYWASNAGTEMWKNWDVNAIREDFQILTSNGINYLRVFPNWRDFQPIIPMMSGGSKIEEYRLENDVVPTNPYYLDETMMDRFEQFCNLCSEYNIKIIVGLITGWMSGRLFIPSGLFGKNVLTDSTALLFEQRFVKGMVSRFKEQKAIYAWDLGNECNCMNQAPDEIAATNWTATISNAIKACDNTRPIVSGMHSLGVDKSRTRWSIAGQAEYTDILTTHPYPFWVNHANKDKIASYRTAMHATCETKLYSDIGKKPCLVEEIGTMGPMICSDEKAADFLRCNLFSNYANGALGVFWWCANEQTNLNTVPYTWSMCEVELGMIDENRKPKPVLKEMRKFSELVKEFDFEITKPKDDAVCILTKSQDQWGVAYMSYCLAKQNDINLKFSFCDEQLSDSDVYMLPSISRSAVIPAENYNFLKKKVFDGATLYISNDNGILSGFNKLTGLTICDSFLENKSETLNLDGETITFSRERKCIIEANGADVLAYDNEGVPAITKYKYGKGTVFYVNFPLEKMLIDESNAFDNNKYKIYKKVFEKTISAKKIYSENKYIAVTEHSVGDRTICIAVNHSPDVQKTNFVFNNYMIEKEYYGNASEISPFDAAVFSIKKK